jgi:hypothetical protein
MLAAYLDELLKKSRVLIWVNLIYGYASPPVNTLRLYFIILWGSTLEKRE